jgi:hypothetical protein
MQRLSHKTQANNLASVFHKGAARPELTDRPELGKVNKATCSALRTYVSIREAEW